MKLIVIILIFIILCSDIFAQNQEFSNRNKKEFKNLVGGSIGISDFHVRDESASPLTYRNMGITGSLEYIRQGDNYKHQIELDAYYTNLKSIYKEYDAINGRAGIRYNYLHKVLSLNTSNNFNLYAGGGLYSFLNLSQYEEHPQNVTSTVANTWYLSHTAELSLLLEYITNISNHFKVQVYLPLIANVSRPAYSVVPGSTKTVVFKLFGDVSPFWENIIIQLKIGYEYTLNKWLSIFAHYDFQYSSYGKPRKVSMYMNNLRAGTYFLF